MKKILLLLGVGVMLVVLSICYYFVFSLPGYNREKLNMEKSKQEEVTNSNNAELSKKIKDDCIKETQNNVTYDFNSSSTTNNPLFYTDDTPESFNKDERILTAISAYSDCLGSDPRNNDNKIIDKLISDSLTAQMIIRTHMTSVKKKKPDICNSYILTASAKQKCNDIFISEETASSSPYKLEPYSK